MTSSHSEIDRLMAEADDMIAFGESIGIDPDDDSEEAQRRLARAWKHHCDQVARNEQGGQVMETERTLAQFETEDLLRELRLREDVVIASWSVDDIANEVEYRADCRGFEVNDGSPLIEVSAKSLKFLADQLESLMIESTFEIVVNEAEEIVDNLIDGGWAISKETATAS